MKNISLRDVFVFSDQVSKCQSFQKCIYFRGLSTKFLESNKTQLNESPSLSFNFQLSAIFFLFHIVENFHTKARVTNLSRLPQKPLYTSAQQQYLMLCTKTPKLSYSNSDKFSQFLPDFVFLHQVCWCQTFPSCNSITEFSAVSNDHQNWTLWINISTSKISRCDSFSIFASSCFFKWVA